MKRGINFTIIGFILFTALLFTIFSCTKKSSTQRELNEIKINSLVSIAEDSMEYNPTLSKKLLQEALHLTQDSLRYYEVYSALTASYFLENTYDTIYKMSKQILKYCNQQNTSPDIHELLTENYNYLGAYFAQMGNLDSAVYYFKLASINVKYSIKSSQIPNVYINLADTYTRKGDYVQSVLYFRKALLASDSLHINEKTDFPIYFGLGQAYYNLGDFDLSDTYFRLAETLLEKRTLSEKFVFCNNRGNYYYYKGEYAQALPWFQKAKALVTPGGYEFHINLCASNLGDIYCKLNQFDSAHYYLDMSYKYFSSLKHTTFLYYISTVNAELALKQNNAGLAHKWINKHNDPKGVEPQILSIRNKCIQNYYLHTANYKKAYEYLSKNVQIDDSIRSEKIKSRVAELDMRYKQDTTLIKRNQLIHAQQNKMKNFQFYKYIWMLICIIVIGTTAFAYLYTKTQRDLAQMKHFDQIAKLRMQNIRNRISPHFAFNVLNQEINSNPDEKKRTNLSELVKLIRRSLEISEQVSVTLSQELEFVQTYIGLEQKSLGDHFILSWEVDNQIDLSSISLPSMIVQIPVENAIKHALRDKDGAKRLCVSLTNKINGVGITIQDNGAGFYPETLSKKGTGTGLKVIYQTIQLLNAKNVEQIGFSISNINNNKTSGTCVDIFIPKNFSYEL